MWGKLSTHGQQRPKIFAMSRLRGSSPLSFLSNVTDAAASRFESSTPSAAMLWMSAGFSGTYGFSNSANLRPPHG
jgi:hypothetical protein